MQNLINGRCGWCGTDELYVAYHDNEWGRLVKAVSYTHLRAHET